MKDAKGKAVARRTFSLGTLPLFNRHLAYRKT